jgi:hypothetical protein
MIARLTDRVSQAVCAGHPFRRHNRSAHRAVRPNRKKMAVLDGDSSREASTGPEREKCHATLLNAA